MDKYANVLAVLMLVAMFGLMLASSWNDSAIFDEVAHIGAGYTYLKYLDGRLNPEHPPLLKSMAALPLLFLSASGRIKENIAAQPFWTMENVNDRQWATGNYLLYEAGNDADRILFWSRLPMILLTILFGWILFSWVKKRYGAAVGLLTLFFFAVSPTFLAHGRYVTTDVGAALGFFLGIIFFLRFLERQDLKSATWLGVVLGLVLLFKFSLVLLLPIYLIILIFKNWNLIENWKLKIRNLALATIIALAVIYAAYIPQIWGYPHDQQMKDARYILAGYQYPSLAKLDFWLTEQTLTRPLGLYLQGFLMVARRTAGGNTAYFMGEISSKGWWSYFPVLAITKEQLGFYILAIIALFTAIKNRARPDFNSLAAIIFIIFYWASSILNPLNIGVRHVLPTFPFLYFLVAKGLISGRPTSYGRRTSIYLISTWMIIETLFAFPYYLSYYNILGGGEENGYKIATDSNYDWGQDLKRLTFWVKENNLDKIYLDYFGGGSPKYYLGDKFEPWWPAKGAPPRESYFAISINSLAGSENLYPWLKSKNLAARAGSSILIYRF
ncbi:MAG: glycosyltransferase family 39 protein [Candidatus Giovannonibacteria bacterium]|nr:MAG: glycosyltransferase family 39 protein [Candidatus Giovannonibacteria bacterium]